MQSKKNRKTIYLVSAAAQVWPKGPTLPTLPPLLSSLSTKEPQPQQPQQPDVVEPEPVVVTPNQRESDTPTNVRKMILTTTDDTQFVKAPRIVYKGHRLSVQCIAVLPTPNKQDTLIFSGGDDKLVMVWSLKTGAKVAELKGHTQRITSIATFHSDGYEPLVISAGWDERLRIWPVKECMSSYIPNKEAESPEISHHAGMSLSDRISAQSVVLKGHKNRIFGIKVIHSLCEEPVVASCSSDNSIRVWSLPEGRLLYVLEDEKDDTWILCVNAWYIRSRIGKEDSLHGTVIISGCKNSTIRVWRHKQGRALMSTMNLGSGPSVLSRKTRTSPALVIRGHTSAVHSVAAFDFHDQSCVVSACKDAELRIWSLTSGALLRVLKGHTSIISTVTAFDPTNGHGGAIIVSASREGANMRVWKYSTGECLRFFKGHTMDINSVEVFPMPDPRHKDDLIIVSGSRDTTVRTWLFAEEKALKVLEHGELIKIKSMDIFHNDMNSIVVTGADDGSVRAWRTARDETAETTPLEWLVEKAHKSQILALTIYTPMPDSDTNHDWPDYLHVPLVISAARNGLIRVCSILDGAEVVPSFLAHNKAITSLCAFSGTKSNIAHRGVDPFVVSGSEDHSARVWSMIDFTCLRTLNRHIFDVTSVAVFLPKQVFRETEKRKFRSNRTGLYDARDADHESSMLTMAAPDPLIITGGMDDTVRLWRYSNGDVVDVLEDADSHITCLSCINIDQTANAKYVGPVLVAGDGNGVIWLWALRSPYELITTLRGHADEVRSVCAFDAEGIPPVLVSGSLDCTVKVWNLETMKLHKTIEGHTADVTAVKIFSLGGSDLALVSASSDTTTRVVFEFMEASPQYDMVMQLFQFDVNGTNSHVTVDLDSAFPRIAQLSRKEGEEAFFGTYYFLYGEALRRSRPDFLEEFLPLSWMGMLKSNKTESFLKTHKGEKEAGYYVNTKDRSETVSMKQESTIAEPGGLLRQALERRDSRAVRCIVSCWCRFFSEHTSELVHDENYGRLSMEDMLLLAAVAPTEFQRLICSIKLIPTKDNYIPPGSHFLFQQDSDRTIQLGRIQADEVVAADKKARAKTIAAPGENIDMNADIRTYHYLPITNAVHMDMLHAYTSTCEELDSVEIFNSDVGKLALSYAWNRMGLHVHLMKMAVYFVYIVISTVSLLTFNEVRVSVVYPIAIFLLVAQIVLNLFFIKEEAQQLAVNPLEYVSDVWNIMDNVVIFSNLLANCLRLVYFHDTMTIDILLCISSVVGYFNILYYLRAFETTGPLVSMILKISKDSMHLLFVVLIVAVGFSQAFWIVSHRNPELPFSTYEGSMLNSFVFMLGGFDPTAFAGTELYRFAIAMACLYMMIVSILLLNLLIALMGDSYGAVKEKGLAQWKLEQAGIITEMQGSMSDEDRKCTAVVYFRKNAEDRDERDTEAEKHAHLEATIAELKANQVHIMKILKDQTETNALLKDFILRSTQQQQTDRLI